MKKKIALTVGRFRILHNGHINYLVKLCNEYDLTVICIGSCFEHGTNKNSILPYFVEKMLRNSLSRNGIDSSKYVITYVSDYPNFEDWIDNILTLCNKYCVTHFVTGNKEDILDVLENKGYVLDMEFINPETTSDFPYHASDIRKAIINQNYELLNLLIPEELQPLVFGSPIFESVLNAEKQKSIHFIPGRQTVDFVVLLKNTVDSQLYVLVGKRSMNKTDFAGYFGIPGGGIDLFETTIEAACRELYEETNLEVKVLKNTFEPAIVKCSNVENSQIEFLRLIGLYSSEDETVSGSKGGSSQCLGMYIEDDILRYRKVLKSDSDLTDVDFYLVEDVLKAGLAYQQSDMVKRAIQIFDAYPLLKKRLV